MKKTTLELDKGLRGLGGLEREDSGEEAVSDIVGGGKTGGELKRREQKERWADKGKMEGDWRSEQAGLELGVVQGLQVAWVFSARKGEAGSLDPCSLQLWAKDRDQISSPNLGGKRGLGFRAERPV